MDHIMDTDTTISLRKCSGCHTTKVINHFGINNKGTHFKTCDNCRLRNKIKRTKQTQEDSTFNTQMEKVDDSIYETMVLTVKSQTIFFKQVLEYTAMLCVIVEIINCRDIISDNEIFKLVFKSTGSMTIIKYYDNLRHVKRLIYEELRNDKSPECTLCLND
jgi:hypothetical protein